MAYRTTFGWSLLSSGVVTLLLSALPGEDLWWGLALCALGLGVLYVRRGDVLAR
jgi:predicted small integral membrane protein